jgi:hypothetical protein
MLIDVVGGAGSMVVESRGRLVVSRVDKSRTTSKTDPTSPMSTTGHFKPDLASNRHNIINVLQN